MIILVLTKLLERGKTTQAGHNFLPKAVAECSNGGRSGHSLLGAADVD